MAKKVKKLPLPQEWRQQAFQMFFSGVEGNTHFQNAYNAGVRYMLMSYFHCKRKGTKMMEERFGKGDIKLLIDSGAHTFMEDIEEYKKKPNEFWEKYIQDYLEWAEKNKKYIFAIVELDVDLIVGEKKVWEWREKYFDPFERRTGIPVCYVFRMIANKTDEQWIKMCKKFRYVGFTGFSDVDVPRMRKLIRLASKYDTVVHGLVA